MGIGSVRVFGAGDLATKSQLRWLIIGRVYTQSRRQYLGLRVGTMRIVTVCYRLVRLVARRALPRHVPVARHFKLVVPGVRADDLASPVLMSQYLKYTL